MPHRPVTLGLAVVALLSLPAAVSGRTAVVPRDFLTIQGALDAYPVGPPYPPAYLNPDTIVVQDGLYPEQIHIRHEAVLLNDRSTAWPYAESFPQVLGVTVESPVHQWGVFESSLTLRGFHVLGTVRLVRTGDGWIGALTFETCRIDSGVDINAEGVCRSFPGPVDMRGCTVLGNVVIVGPNNVIFMLNAVIGGGVSIGVDGRTFVKGNVVQGPADVGIDFQLCGAFVEVEANLVSGVGIGIRFLGDGGQRTTVRNNVVRDCSGTGIEGYHSTRYDVNFGGMSAVGNRILRCGGYGFDLHKLTSGEISRNVVDSCGRDGLWIS